MFANYKLSGKVMALAIAVVVCYGHPAPAAADAPQWKRFSQTMFGYSGARIETVLSNQPTNADFTETFYFADHKSYLLKNGTKIAITENEFVRNRLGYSLIGTRLSSVASINKQGFVWRSAKFDNTFIATQAFMGCPTGSFSGRSMLNNEAAAVSTLEAICPFGAFPIWAQGQFAHGVRDKP